MTEKSPPISQMINSSMSGISLRSNETRAATQAARSTIIRPSCGEGSMKAIELSSTVTNSMRFKSRCTSGAVAASAASASRSANVAGLANSLNRRSPCAAARTASGRRCKVEQDRPVLDVVEVMLDALLDLFLAVGLTAPAVDLRPAGDARFDPVAGEIAVHSLVV